MPRTNRHQSLVDDLLGMPRKRASVALLKQCEERAKLLEEIVQLVSCAGYRKVLPELMRKTPWAEYAVGTLRQLKQAVQIALTKQLTSDQFKENVLTWCDQWLEEMKRLHQECLAARALAESIRKEREVIRKKTESLRRARQKAEAELAALKAERGRKRKRTEVDLFARKKARGESSSEPDETSSEVSHAAH